jgi:methyl-accepting chemotaxis protein
VSNANGSAVEQVASSMTQVTHSVNTIAQSVRELTDISETLKGLVAQFRV